MPTSVVALMSMIMSTGGAAEEADLAVGIGLRRSVGSRRRASDVPSKLTSDRVVVMSGRPAMPSSQPYAVTYPFADARSTVSWPMTVLPPAASGTATRTTPPAATRGAALAGPRVSVRRFGNDVDADVERHCVDVDDQVDAGVRVEAHVAVGVGLDDETVRRDRRDPPVVVDVRSGDAAAGVRREPVVAAEGGDVAGQRRRGRR